MRERSLSILTSGSLIFSSSTYTGSWSYVFLGSPRRFGPFATPHTWRLVPVPPRLEHSYVQSNQSDDPGDINPIQQWRIITMDPLSSSSLRGWPQLICPVPGVSGPPAHVPIGKPERTDAKPRTAKTSSTSGKNTTTPPSERKTKWAGPKQSESSDTKLRL